VIGRGGRRTLRSRAGGAPHGRPGALRDTESRDVGEKLVEVRDRQVFRRALTDNAKHRQDVAFTHPDFQPRSRGNSPTEARHLSRPHDGIRRILQLLPGRDV